MTAGVLLALSAAGYGGYAYVSGNDAAPAVETAGRTHEVRPMDLDITVRQEGELEAVRNIEVRNEVDGRRTITWLIPEGTRVGPGEVVARLDPEDLENEVERSEQDLVQHQMKLVDEREQLDWQLTQNSADLEAAEVDLNLSEMELAMYTKGAYPKQLGEAEAKLSSAQTNLAREREDLQTSLGLYARGFVTAKKVKEDQQAVRDAERDVESARIALELLVEYEHPMALSTKQNDLSQARNALDRQRVRGKSAETNRRAQVARAEEQVKRTEDRLHYKREQFALCTVEAPAAGLVVYGGDGRNEVAVGEPSHHRQTLVLLPDTGEMKAVVRVPENRVSLLREGMAAVVDKAVEGFRPLGASVRKISVLAESGGAWYDRDSRQYPVDLVLAETPAGLKPGLKVQATVFVDRLKDVLAVPLACVYNQQDKAFVFVETPDGEAGVEPRLIGLGRASETHAQVESGLAAGERIIELEVGEGRDLLERFGLLRGEAGDESTSAPPEAVRTAATDRSPVSG